MLCDRRLLHDLQQGAVAGLGSGDGRGAGGRGLVAHRLHDLRTQGTGEVIYQMRSLELR